MYEENRIAEIKMTSEGIAAYDTLLIVEKYLLRRSMYKGAFKR